eukprot:COSAG01_NODE_4758_length_4761_cov_54.944444_4_plen_247_part_00
MIRDGPSGRAVPYTGSFRLTVVAGGPSYGAMRDYTPEEQAAFSMWPEALPGGAAEQLGPPSHPVFGFLEAEEMSHPTRSGRSKSTEIDLPLGRGALRSGRGAPPSLEAGWDFRIGVGQHHPGGVRRAADVVPPRALPCGCRHRVDLLAGLTVRECLPALPSHARVFLQVPLRHAAQRGGLLPAHDHLHPAAARAADGLPDVHLAGARHTGRLRRAAAACVCRPRMSRGRQPVNVTDIIGGQLNPLH